MYKADGFYRIQLIDQNKITVAYYKKGEFWRWTESTPLPIRSLTHIDPEPLPQRMPNPVSVDTWMTVPKEAGYYWAAIETQNERNDNTLLHYDGREFWVWWSDSHYPLECILLINVQIEPLFVSGIPQTAAEWFREV